MTLSVTNLKKDLGSVRLLEGIEFSLDDGLILGIAGTHAISKTTLMRVLAGVSQITSGEVRVDSRPVSDSAAKLATGYMPRKPGGTRRTTVIEFMEFYGSAFRVRRGLRGGVIEGVLRLVDLWDLRDSMVSDLDETELLRLAFGRILMHNPKLLILDEPLAAFGAEETDQFAAIVKELKAMGKSVIFTCLDPEALDGIADVIAVLHRGRFADFGPAAEVLARIREGGWPPESGPAPQQAEAAAGQPAIPVLEGPAAGPDPGAGDGLEEAGPIRQTLRRAGGSEAIHGMWPPQPAGPKADAGSKDAAGESPGGEGCGQAGGPDAGAGGSGPAGGGGAGA